MGIFVSKILHYIKTVMSAYVVWGKFAKDGKQLHFKITKGGRKLPPVLSTINGCAKLFFGKFHNQPTLYQSIGKRFLRFFRMIFSVFLLFF